MGESTSIGNVRPIVEEVLRNWRSHEWQIQGFGMLRTYLPGDTEPRLQVWDQRLACWGNNAIHDHPWRFTSTIVAGTIFNTRYQITHPASYMNNGCITEIKPGTRGGLLAERPVVGCFIAARPVEVYAMGDSYGQEHREMHLTRYAQGTVTLIRRYEREAADVARVAWFGEDDDQPPFANPYPAPPEVTERVVTDALRRWWL